VTAITLRDRLPGSNIGRVSSVKILGGAMNSTLTCLHCGGDLGSDDRFCALCGAESLACASCGQLLLATDHSCPHCGTPAERVVPPDPPATQTDSPSPWAEMVERLRRATLGEFEIGRELGRGGMAAVFLAHDIALDRKVAIKVMSPALMLGDGMIDRFRHEAVTVASLHHPNIVPVYSVRQAEGLHFFVMRYVEGPSLEEVIQRAGRLPLPIVRSILYQVGAALTHAHRSQVIHRDIKPANILIDADGTAIVTDFGIAKAAERPTRTLSGTLVGTPAYMSPEQCRGVEISGASDQYALGVVAYEMLTGRPPFGGSTLTIMQAHVEESPAPIAGRCEGCPAEVEAAFLRMLAKDPAARWPRLVDATAALGAAPLSEDDPHRAELSRLAAWSGSPIGPITISSALGSATSTRSSALIPLQLAVSSAEPGASPVAMPPAPSTRSTVGVSVPQVTDCGGSRVPCGPRMTAASRKLSPTSNPAGAGTIEMPPTGRPA
jgi:serine/threonine-protein kinase